MIPLHNGAPFTALEDITASEVTICHYRTRYSKTSNNNFSKGNFFFLFMNNCIKILIKNNSFIYAKMVYGQDSSMICPKENSPNTTSILRILFLNFIGKAVKLIFGNIFYNGLCGEKHRLS